MSDARTVVVGDVLWFESNDPNPRGYPVEVTKVGRKWGHTGVGRFDLITWYFDGGNYSSPGRVYRSLDAADAERNRRAQWSTLKAAINRRWTVPDGVTVEYMKSVADGLGLGDD